jgi:hypothetical protein
LALEVNVDESGKAISLGGVWDYRDDPEGVCFGDLSSSDAIRKARNVLSKQECLRESRRTLLGYEIQPIPETTSGKAAL